MPEATHQHTTPGPDAALIAACAVVDALEQRYCWIMNEFPVRFDDEAADAMAEPAKKAQEPHLHLICTTWASTPEGIVAKARTLAMYEREEWHVNRH